MKHSFWFVTVMIFMLSCNSRDVYMQYVHIDKGNWHKDSVVNFNVDITDTATFYNLYVNLRNRSEYPYQNIWLFVETVISGSPVMRDTIEFYLADDMGKWLGTGIGAVYDMPVLYRQNYRFANSGNCKFSIQHGMRDTVLKGINDVGLHIERISN